MKRSVYVDAYVIMPFETVRSLMRDTPGALFGMAAENKGPEVLTVAVGAHAGVIPIHDRFAIEFGSFEEAPGHYFATLHVKFAGDKHHVLVPDVDAKVEAIDEGYSRTELRLVGSYEPRMGPAGALEDVLLGHHAVEEAMQQVLYEVRNHLGSVSRTTGRPK